MLFYPNFFKTPFQALIPYTMIKILNLMQLKKLAVLGNVCFWLTLLFQYGKWARNIQQDLLNTIVMLGLLAVIINLVWIVIFFTVKTNATSVVAEKEKAKLLFTWFNLLSFASQLVFLFFKFL